MTETARLQLRWTGPIATGDQWGYRDWICHYELLLPLHEHDIRREGKSGRKVRSAQILKIAKTKRNSKTEPCRTNDGAYYFDTPYRDGAHAIWDAAKLGGLPIVCIAIDGTVIEKESAPDG